MASTASAQTERGDALGTPEAFHAGKVAEIQAFLTAGSAERGPITSSSVVDRESYLPAYEEPVEVRDAVSDMSRAMRALQEAATFRKLTAGDFEAVVDITAARVHLGEGLENAVFMGRDLGSDGYELTFRKTDRHKLVDGGFSGTGGNWGDTRVTLRPDTVEVRTQDNTRCVWSREAKP